MDIKKVVNGRNVRISNIELFELAAEGLLMQNITMNSTAEAISKDIKGEIANKLITQYNILFKSMPYPLYAIESSLKYATIATFIKVINEEEYNMWINDGLYIEINSSDGQTLHLINNTWSIVSIETSEDNTDLENFKDEPGYEQYTWFLEKILGDHADVNFYEQFMPEFYAACNGNDMIFQNEIKNILNFAILPEKLKIESNTILDTDKNCEYTLDIYQTGYAETEEKENVWSLASSYISSRVQNKRVRVYGYTAYSKALTKEASENFNIPEKLTETKMPGLQQLFTTLVGIKNAQEIKKFTTYYGVILNNHLIFFTDRSLFITRSNRTTDVKEIAKGVELYGINSNCVYFTRSKRINSMIQKEQVWCLNLTDMTTTLCKIEYKIK